MLLRLPGKMFSRAHEFNMMKLASRQPPRSVFAPSELWEGSYIRAMRSGVGARLAGMDIRRPGTCREAQDYNINR